MMLSIPSGSIHSTRSFDWVCAIRYFEIRHKSSILKLQFDKVTVLPCSLPVSVQWSVISIPTSVCFILYNNDMWRVGWAVQNPTRLTLKFTFNKATLHHVEEDCDHYVQQVTLLCHVSSQLLIAKQLHTDMYDAIGHGVRLVAFHQRFHDECIMLNKCLCKGDLPERKREKPTTQFKLTVKMLSLCLKYNLYSLRHLRGKLEQHETYLWINANTKKEIPCNLDLATCSVRRWPSSVGTRTLLSKTATPPESIYASENQWSLGLRAEKRLKMN